MSIKNVRPGAFFDLYGKVRAPVRTRRAGEAGILSAWVGTTFVIGDYDRVLPYCRQMVINPFRGYRDEEKSILDPSLGETVKEFSTIDGAFILRGDGVIMSAGTFLRPEKGAVSLPSGLGARHAAAAALAAQSPRSFVLTANPLYVWYERSGGRVYWIGPEEHRNQTTLFDPLARFRPVR